MGKILSAMIFGIVGAILTISASASTEDTYSEFALYRLERSGELPRVKTGAATATLNVEYDLEMVVPLRSNDGGIQLHALSLGKLAVRFESPTSIPRSSFNERSNIPSRSSETVILEAAKKLEESGLESWNREKFMYSVSSHILDRGLNESTKTSHVTVTPERWTWNDEISNELRENLLALERKKAGLISLEPHQGLVVLVKLSQGSSTPNIVSIERSLDMNLSIAGFESTLRDPNGGEIHKAAIQVIAGLIKNRKSPNVDKVRWRQLIVELRRLHALSKVYKDNPRYALLLEEILILIQPIERALEVLRQEVFFYKGAGFEGRQLVEQRKNQYQKSLESAKGVFEELKRHLRITNPCERRLRG
ncbi:MAG: hypothetical protein AB1540_15190 [Bdellovibrionota bacterium]